jgi:hypothetical protein
MNINKKQRVILWGIIGVVVLMLIFPPHQPGNGCYNELIFHRYCNDLISWGQLVAQFMVVLFIGGASFLLAQDRGTK